jgi:hypothetical protein
MRKEGSNSFENYADPNNRNSDSSNFIVASLMSTDGMLSFFTALQLNLDSCESMLAVYYLGWSSFLRITRDEFERALKTHGGTFEGVRTFVRAQIQKHAVS